jgi:hypothetical protein
LVVAGAKAAAEATQRERIAVFMVPTDTKYKVWDLSVSVQIEL